ncbi:MAG: ankyrin repeat domain-containing protein [Myxococcota bacterium]
MPVFPVRLNPLLAHAQPAERPVPVVHGNVFEEEPRNRLELPKTPRRLDHVSALEEKFFKTGVRFLQDRQYAQAVLEFIKLAERSLALKQLHKAQRVEDPRVDTMISLGIDYAQSVYRFASYELSPGSFDADKSLIARLNAALAWPETTPPNEKLPQVSKLLNSYPAFSEMGDTWRLNEYTELVMKHLGISYQEATALVIERELQIVWMGEAIRRDSVQILRDLVARGFDVNRPSSAVVTPLVAAAKLGSLEVIGELLRMGAKMGTALFEAIKAGHHEVAAELARQGACIFINVPKNTPDSVVASVHRGFTDRLHLHPEEAALFFAKVDHTQIKASSPLDGLPVSIPKVKKTFFERLRSKPELSLRKSVLACFREVFKMDETFLISEERAVPFTAAQIESHLDGLLENVETEREKMAGVPKCKEERTQFYATLRAMLTHIHAKLKDKNVSLADKRTVLVTLAQGGMHCGTRQFYETKTALGILFPSRENTTEAQGKILKELESLRHAILIEISSQFRSINAHSFGHLVHTIGKEVGVSNMEFTYTDPLVGNATTKEELLKQFYDQYTPSRIWQHLSKMPAADLASLLAEARPPGCNENEFYDLTLQEDGTLQPAAVIVLMFCLGIIVPCSTRVDRGDFSMLGLHAEHPPELMFSLGKLLKDKPAFAPYERHWQPETSSYPGAFNDYEVQRATEVLAELKLLNEQKLDLAAKALKQSQTFYRDTKRALSDEQAKSLARHVIFFDDL